ncbi:MAG: outer membrane beta-barrel domain-containing protein [Bdellovibrionales bacterium]|nr:outer membrane beta-barrel domain-containing protein [Bdellovibrionales bacterium]
MIKIFLLALQLACSAFAATEKVEFPDEELARESVLPVFDRSEPVKNRNVMKTGAIELAPTFGFTVNDPFYSGFNGGMLLGYHFNDEHAMTVMGSYFSSEKSQYAKALEEDDFQNFDNFPTLEYLVILGYDYSPYYGKMSITKQSVFNIDLFFHAGIGSVSIGGENGFAGELGFGQKFYFGKSWGIRVDFKGLMYNGPDYTSVDNGGSETDVEDPTIADFDKEFTARLLITVGAEILL